MEKTTFDFATMAILGFEGRISIDFVEEDSEGGVRVVDKRMMEGTYPTFDLPHFVNRTRKSAGGTFCKPDNLERAVFSVIESSPQKSVEPFQIVAGIDCRGYFLR